MQAELQFKIKNFIRLNFLRKTFNSHSGQVLVSLLMFIIITIIITSAAVVIMVVNSESGSKTLLGDETYYVAESGAENALIRLLRDTSYTGEVLQVGQGTATINVTGTNPQTITSTAVMGNFRRIIQVTVSYTNNILSVTSWQEI